MEIYIIRKHRTYVGYWGRGWNKAFVIFDVCSNKKTAQAICKRLNAKSREFTYKVQKLTAKD